MAFQYSLIANVTIPNSVTSIAGVCFGSSKVELVILSDLVTEMGQFAFAACGWLRSLIIPDEATIDSPAFNDYYFLEERSLSVNVTIKTFVRKPRQQRIKLRATVLSCLWLINNRRMIIQEEYEANSKRRKLNNDNGSSSGSSSGINDNSKAEIIDVLIDGLAIEMKRVVEFMRMESKNEIS